MGTGRFRRMLLFVGGTACVVLGVVGIVLPLLPTTPFLLLAAVCYARSSERFYRWLMTSRWLGQYIRNYREKRGLPLRQKVLTLALLWLTVGYVVGFVTAPWWVKGLLLGVGGGVTVYLLRMTTIRPEAGRDRLGGERPGPEEPG